MEKSLRPFKDQQDELNEELSKLKADTAMLKADTARPKADMMEREACTEGLDADMKELRANLQANVWVAKHLLRTNKKTAPRASRCSWARRQRSLTRQSLALGAPACCTTGIMKSK